MQVHRFIPTVLSFMFLLSSCEILSSQGNGDEAQDESEEFERRELPRSLSTSEQEVVATSSTFGFELLREVASDDSQSNHFISPLSVSMAYLMAMNGADNETRDQIRSTLGYHDMDDQEVNEAYQSLIELLTEFDDDVEFNIANSIWHRDSFDIQQNFLDINREYLNAVIQAADFNDDATVDEINQWVAEHTNDLIQQIVEGPIDPLTMMYLINAIYFSGDWTVPFDEEQTRDESFYLADEQEIEVPMMTLPSDYRVPFTRTQEYKAMDLFYGDAGFAMTVILPDEDTPMDEFISGLDSQYWQEITDSMQETELAEITLPRFEVEYEVEDFPQILRNLGIIDAFDPDLSDFSRINPDHEDLHISDSRHKTFISVDEKGTDAAAVTSAEISVTSVPPSMRVDRPFLYAIREVESNTILFIGTMMNPAE